MIAVTVLLFGSAGIWSFSHNPLFFVDFLG